MRFGGVVSINIIVLCLANLAILYGFEISWLFVKAVVTQKDGVFERRVYNCWVSDGCACRMVRKFAWTAIFLGMLPIHVQDKGQRIGGWPRTAVLGSFLVVQFVQYGQSKYIQAYSLRVSVCNGNQSMYRVAPCQ